jgi:uncharacterized linocin/CFP29 family protein
MTVYEDAAKQFDKQMVPPFRQRIMGRRLFAKTTVLESGETELNYDKITEMGPAGISFGLKPKTIPADNIKVAASTLKVPTLAQKFTVPRRTIDAYAAKGKDFESAVRDSAYHTLAKLEDDLLIRYWAQDGVTADINGLYESAGNTEGTSSVTSTYGNMIIKLNLAMAVLETDSAADWSFNLTLAPGNFHEVVNSFSTTGVSEYDAVLKILNAGGTGQAAILKSADITANTGMLTPVDSNGECIDLVIARDVQTVPRNPEYNGVDDPEFLVFEEIVPRIKQTDSICTLTGL